MTALPSDTVLLDYLDAHPTACFEWEEGAPAAHALNLLERDQDGGVWGLGSGATPRHAIADAIAGERRVRHCHADGCKKEAVMLGYCSMACFLDPNGEGY